MLSLLLASFLSPHPIPCRIPRPRSWKAAMERGESRAGRFAGISKQPQLLSPSSALCSFCPAKRILLPSSRLNPAQALGFAPC